VCLRDFLPRWSRCRTAAIALALAFVTIVSSPASAADRIYFPAVDNVIDVLVEKIRLETVRVDISCWYLTEHAISIALINKFNSGVPVRLLGDRGSIFEIDPRTKNEFYWLASQGLPIRLRYYPTWFPEINHWKMSIFVGQNLVSFGSANYTPFELAPASALDFKDETVLLSDDPSLVNAFKTKFDRMWNDTTIEPESLNGGPPYFKNWNDACATEFTGNCADYPTLYPNPVPMIINTARLEPDNFTDLPDMVWGQGPDFNNRLIQEIDRETNRVDFVIYRITVDNVTQSLLNKFQSGVPLRLIIEPNEYLNRKWPEFWLTHANLDRLYAAGVPIKQRVHNGLTHAKMLVTSMFATNASSNLAAAWQRDHDYFVPAATKPVVYQAMADRFQTMWTSSGFADFKPQPPDDPALASPVSNASNVPTTAPLVWKLTPFAVSYDVYLGTSQANMTRIGNVPAQMVNSPPSTYSWTPVAPLQPGTMYFWRIIARTNATPVNPALVGVSPVWAFTTAGAIGPPPPPTSPTPSDGATGVSTSPTLGWAPGGVATTYNVAFGVANPPPTVATGLSPSSYVAGALAAATTYFWRVTPVTSGGSTPGPVWSFTTAAANGGGTAADVVIYAADVDAIHGVWSKVSDPTAAAGIKLTNPDNGVAALPNPLPSPADYFDVSFSAVGGTPYRVWLRIHAINDLKWNDSVFVQYSDSVDSTGAPTYRIGTTSAVMVNLWTCSTCQSFGWGWQRNAYWLADTGDVLFQNSGAHTLRVQVREDGAEIDQIVLSPVTYATNAPGPVSNDNTIVPKAAQAPGAPGLPNPANGATGVGINPTLTWTASAATSYDVRFGTSNPPPPVVSGVSTASYTPAVLTNGTTYFWQVISRNATDSATGPVWSFTTAVAAPETPSSPSPAHGATGVATNATLTWTSSGATTYDVLFGTTDPPAQVASGISTPSYTPAGLVAGTTYFWQIVAHNSGGANQGPQWTFTTVPPVQPPSPSTTPSPADGATGISTAPTLTWSATGATSYDVAFGTTNPPPVVSSNQTAASYTPACECAPSLGPTPLAYDTTYFWRITAHSSGGGTTGAVWSFRTAPNPNPPSSPFSPNPADMASGVSTTAALSWSGQNTTSYDVKFGTTNPPPQVATGQTNTAYTPAMTAGTTYFWQIVAHNPNGSTSGAVWSFSTGPSTLPPPAVPTSPVPSDHATNVGINGTFNWSSAGATTHDVHFGTINPPPLVATVCCESWTPPTMTASTTYFWQIVAHNNGGTTAGPLWSFTTAATPAPPETPHSPSPIDAATNVSLNTTLTWTSSAATTFDLSFGTTNPPAQVSAGQAAASFTPSGLASGTTYFWQIVAHSGSGTTSGPVWSFTTSTPPANTNVLVYASDIPAGALHGSWTAASDPASPNGIALVTPDNGWATTSAPLAAPVDYIDVTFAAQPGTPYALWLRLKALNNSKFNDSVWVQYSDAIANGFPVYPLNSTSGLLVNLATDAGAASLNNWGWENGAYWLSQATTVTFASSGTHTMRIQLREDGVRLDQIVLSPTTYLSVAPGTATNDSTIVPKP